MNPKTWRDMVERSRELEYALGTGVKTVEDNERDTVILQRRSIRVKKDLSAGTVLEGSMIEELRPAPSDAVFPYQKNSIIGKRLKLDKVCGDYLKLDDMEG